jgi:predicted ATPase
LKSVRNTDEPRLKKITLLRERVENWKEYPFNIRVIRNFKELELRSRICFFVGENGSGKSTLLEAIADHCGFGREGGSKHIRVEETPEHNEPLSRLSRALRLSWSNKILTGYFFRAESFFNIATYIERLGGDALIPYGGVPLHIRSHGEALLALFENRFFKRRGFYLMDEPEAALSPQRQLSFLLILHNLLNSGPEVQVIVATHSPIILSYPGAQILSFDGRKLEEIKYEQTTPYQVVSGFLKNPALYLKKLLADDQQALF